MLYETMPSAVLLGLSFFLITYCTIIDNGGGRNTSSSVFNSPFEEAEVHHKDFESQAKFIYRLYCQKTCLTDELMRRNMFCSKCYCDIGCNYYRDCCPDYQDLKYHKPVNMTCARINIPPSDFIQLVDNCPDNYQNKVIRHRCQSISAYNWRLVQPVTDSETHISYRNRYCAYCHGVVDVNHRLQWDIGANCNYGLPDMNPSMSKEDVYLSILNDGGCNIMFFPPSNVSVRRCHDGFQDIIQTCNETGYWVTYDSLIEYACLNYPENPVRGNKNVFCYICNTYLTWEEIKENIIGHQPNVFRVSLSALLDLDDEPNDDEHNLDTSCQWQDPYQCQCRNITCADEKKYEDGKCRFLVRMTNYYIYDFCLKGKLVFNAEIVPSGVVNDFLESLLRFMNALNAVIGLARFQPTYISPCDEIMTILFSANISIFFREQVKMEDFEQTVLLMVKNGVPLHNEYIESELSFAKTCSSDTLYINSDLTMPCSDYQTHPEVLTQFNITVDQNLIVRSKRITFSKLFSCPRIVLETDEAVLSSDNTSLLILANNNTLYDTEFKIVSEGGYLICLEDYLPGLDAEEPSSMCQERNPSSSVKVPNYSVLGILSGICTSVSVIFLLITLMVFCSFKQLRTTIGLGIIALAISLIIAQVLFEFGAEQTDIEWVCQTIAMLSHFFWLSSTFWMNICTLILFYKLNFPMKARHICNRKLLIGSTVYCWGCSGLIVMIVAVSAYVTDGSTGYGGTSCYISGSNGRRYGVAVPVGLLVVINIILFAYTFIKLKMNEKLQSNKETEISMLACLKLSVITGLTWVFAFLFEATGSIAFAYLFTVFVGSQGFVIFLAFVANRRVYNMIRCSGFIKYWNRSSKSTSKIEEKKDTDTSKLRGSSDSSEKTTEDDVKVIKPSQRDEMLQKYFDKDDQKQERF